MSEHKEEVWIPMTVGEAVAMLLKEDQSAILLTQHHDTPEIHYTCNIAERGFIVLDDTGTEKLGFFESTEDEAMASARRLRWNPGYERKIGKVVKAVSL